MTNIQKALLSNVYPHIDIALLEEVINATSNTELATEILCGIYLEPEIPTMVWKSKENGVFYNKESFNKWTNMVSYSYMSPKSVGSGYFPLSIKPDDINETNYKDLKVGPDHNDCRYMTIYSSTEKEKVSSSMDLEKWCKLSPVDMTELPVECYEKEKEFTRHPSDKITHTL